MRLTLRTLLAYLDDTLEPAQARVIGQKVAESETARELIERIKNVTRRRRLAAPPVTGAGSKLDPNVIADYIDNVLPDDQVAEVEENILKTDVLLAEVAASHQILTLFLGQPAEVPPTARQRMVGLVKGPEARPFRKAPADEAAGPTGATDTSAEADEALLLGTPARRNRWAGRLVPVGAVFGLVVLLLVALWQIIPRGSGTFARNDTRPGRTETTAAPEPRTTPEAPPPAIPDKAPPAVPDKAPPPKPPEKEPEPKPEDKQPIHVAPDPKPAPERKPVGKYVATADPAPSVLLQRVAGKETWQRLKNDAPVHSGDLLVSLPGYRSEVHAANGVVLTLWGLAAPPLLESAATLHVPTDGFDVDCTLDRGLVVITNQRPAAKARVRVRFHDESWEVTLDENGSSVALNLLGEYPGGIPFNKEGKGEAPLAVLELFGLTGAASVTINYQTFALPVPGVYRWDNSGPRSRGAQPVPRDALRWLLDKEPPDKDTVAALKDLAARLDKKDVSIALAETRKEAKGHLLVLSVFCLGGIDDLNNLVLSLGDDRIDVRWFANQTLRHWIGIRAENDLKLYREVLKRYAAKEAETIMRLLHGFARDDWNKIETYEWLIGDLESKELAIRELAYYHLWTHVPEAKKIGYDPGAPADVRGRALAQWKKLLEDGKLPAKGK